MIVSLIISVIIIALACYVAFREVKHHELHKLRACFSDIHKHIEEIEVKKGAQDDPETMEILKGELIGIEKAMEVLNQEDRDLFTEIKEDIAKIKEKLGI